MIKIFFNKDAGYKASEKYITSNLKKYLKENGVDYDVVVSIMVGSEDRVEKLARIYMGERGESAKGHPVLSFCEKELEEEFVLPEEERKTHYLGEIVVSYEYAEKEAKKEKKEVDEVILKWAKHGALHLLGIHHD